MAIVGKIDGKVVGMKVRHLRVISSQSDGKEQFIFSL